MKRREENSFLGNDPDRFRHWARGLNLGRFPSSPSTLYPTNPIGSRGYREEWQTALSPKASHTRRERDAAMGAGEVCTGQLGARE